MPLQFKVYRNPAKNCYAVQNKYGQGVVEHAAIVSLFNVSFIIDAAKRLQVIDRNKPQVHAYAIGERLYSNKLGVYDQSFTKIMYDPMESDYFFARVEGSERKVLKCQILVMTPQGMFGKGVVLEP